METKTLYHSLPNEVRLQLHGALSTLSDSLSNHCSEMRELLISLLPEELWKQPLESILEWMKENLPHIRWDEDIQAPDVFTIYLLCSPTGTLRVEGLFIDLLKKWLIPDKEVTILGMRHFPFFLRESNPFRLHLLEVKLLIETEKEFLTIKYNLPTLAKEIALSLKSAHYAEYLLNSKPITSEHKANIVHQELRQLFQRFSSFFDQDIFTDFSRFIVLTTLEFRTIRSVRHLTRIVAFHYLMRRELLRALNKFSEKRQLLLRFIPTDLHFVFGSKSVLGLVIAIGPIDKYESFDEWTISHAVQKWIEDVQIVKGSYCQLRGAQDPLKGIYLELEKKNETSFSTQEIRLLKRELAAELKNRIEKLIPSVFMVRNEEETIRNILLLSQELADPEDIPQVMISFEKQTERQLVFTVVLVRLILPDQKTLTEAFLHSPPGIEFSLDRQQNVGYLAGSIPKEANVFHLAIPKERSLLRADASVNFYLARQQIVHLLQSSLGEIRDYNGGMLLKQGELYAQFKETFRAIAQKNEELLENFFFGLSPIEVQATLPLDALETLFNLILEALAVNLEKREHYFLKLIQQPGRLFVGLRTRDFSIEEDLSQEFAKLDTLARSLIKTKISHHGQALFGFIFESNEIKIQNQIYSAIEAAIKRWVQRIRSQQVLRLSMIELPSTLDPRQGADELSVTVLKMLFDGLTRIGLDKKTILSIAKSVEITSDLRQYTFKLRPCLWSDGSKLIAYDFEYAWKKILSPHFKTQYAYMFYSIKNARLAKEGKVALEKLGARAIDEETLVVQLEHPTPEFLELTAHPLYSPINHRLERVYPNWAQGGEDVYVCNGPFKLKKIFPNGGLELVKNPLYWDEKAVNLERILITKEESTTANELFKNSETDWLGRPLRSWEPYFANGCSEIVRGAPIWTHWCILNVQRFPFHNLKIRQAFALAVNRRAFHSLLSQGAIPAGTPLPFPHTQCYKEELTRCDPERARQLFEEGLQELGLQRKDFPLLILVHYDTKARREAAKVLQTQFQEVLGLPCRPEGYAFNQFFPKITSGDYQMGIISWKPFINDPMYTLDVFKYKNNFVNFSKWEHVDFQRYLNLLESEVNPHTRMELIKSAEKLLIEEKPIIPLFYDFNNYMHKDYLKSVLHTPTGSVDFKWASIVRGGNIVES